MGMYLAGAGFSYNWHAWRKLYENLKKWGLDVSELQFSNDGDPISQKTCQAIANALSEHRHEYHPDDLDWVDEQIDIWRSCRGCSQY